MLKRKGIEGSLTNHTHNFMIIFSFLSFFSVMQMKHVTPSQSLTLNKKALKIQILP